MLDVCTGSGAIAISAALGGARSVTAVDISRRAVLTVRLNARLNGVHVETVRGDLLGAVPGRRFDVIVSNPPYLPADDDALPATRQRTAHRGRHHRPRPAGPADRRCARPPDARRVLLVTHSSVNGEEATLARMRAAGLEPAVAERRRGGARPAARRASPAARGARPARARRAHRRPARGRRRRVKRHRRRGTRGDAADANASRRSAAAAALARGAASAGSRGSTAGPAARTPAAGPMAAAAAEVTAAAADPSRGASSHASAE